MGGCTNAQHLQDEDSESSLSALRGAPGRCDRQFSSAATKPVTVLAPDVEESRASSGA